MEREAEQSDNLGEQGSGLENGQKQLLSAICDGNLEDVKRHLETVENVNFTDQNGDTPLHHAVQSRLLAVVEEILKRTDVDVTIENNMNQIPLDIAREKKYWKISDSLVKKTIENSLDVLNVSSNNNKCGRPSTSPVEEKIKQIEDKIECCLKRLEKINTDLLGAKPEDISYEQANIFIYFLETFALEGDPATKGELKKHFSQYYNEFDRDFFSRVRTDIVHSPVSELRLKDIQNLMNVTISDFFQELQAYVKYVQDVKGLRVFLEEIRKKYSKIEMQKPEVRTFLENEFGDFITKSNMKMKIDQRKVLEFIIHFYPAFPNGCSKEEMDSFFRILQQYVQYVQCMQRLEDPNQKKECERQCELIKEIPLHELQNLMWYFYLALHPFYENDKSTKEMKCSGSLRKFDRTELKAQLTAVSMGNDVAKSNLDSKIKELIKSEDEESVKKVIKTLKDTQRSVFFIKALVGDENKIGQVIKDVNVFVTEKFKTLLVVAYTKEGMTEETLFNFVVNFHPALRKKTKGYFEELWKLRNKLIHDFHKYGIREFRQDFSMLRHIILKYYFAHHINEELCTVQSDTDCQNIHKTFTDKLKLIKEELKVAFDQKPVLSQDAAAAFFGYKFSELRFSETFGDHETLVHQYLKYMIIFDARESEECEKQDQREELDASSRRKIFEKFVELESLYRDGTNECYKDKKSEFQKELRKNYGVSSSDFERTIGLYIENTEENTDLVDESDIREISETVKILKNSRNDCNLSTQHIIALYGHFLEKKHSFLDDKNNDTKLILKNKSEYKDNLKEKFKLLPEDTCMTIKIDQETLCISRGKVICNILNALFNTYNKYRIDFNIEEMFNDEQFLNCLAVRLEKQVKGKLKFENPMIIRKLLEVGDYTAPYIVRLITRVEEGNTIEKNDSVKLLRILITGEEGLYIKHLNELLKIKRKKLNLYKEVCREIDKKNTVIGNMCLIFENLQHLKGILSLRTKTKVTKYLNSQLAIKILEIVTYKVLKFISSNKSDAAIEIFKYALEVIEGIKSTEPESEVNRLKYDIKLKIAGVKIYRAKTSPKNKKEKDENKTAKKKCNEALELLEQIPDACHPQCLLALYYKAKAHNALKEYKVARNEYHSLYNEIKKLAGVSDKSTSDDTKEIYTKIQDSEEYENLINTTEVYKKNLDILYIREAMAEANLNIDLEIALKIYKEVYIYKKDKLGLTHTSTAKSIRYIFSAHISTGKKMFERNSYPVALEHYEDALVWNVRLLKIQREKYGDFHPAIKRNIQFIASNLYHIASVNDKLKKPDYERILAIYRKVHNYQKHNLGETHVFTLKANIQIAIVEKKIQDFENSK